MKEPSQSGLVVRDMHGGIWVSYEGLEDGKLVWRRVWGDRPITRSKIIWKEAAVFEAVDA